MLDLFRKQKAASKWILGIICGIMALGMVVFFIPAPTGSSDALSASAVAKVGKSEISTVLYSTTFRRFLKNSRYPKNMDFLKQVGIPRQLLNQLITEQLLMQEAEKFGFNVSDRELRDRLLAYPVFQQMGGKFNMDVYARVLQQSGLTVDEFEESERTQLIVDKLRHLITDGIIVSSSEVEEYYRNNNETVTLDYVLFDPVETEKATTVDEAALKKYYETNKQKFTTTEQRRVKYVLVDVNKIRASSKLTDEDLRQYYEQNRTRYFVSDRTRMSHILFRTTGKSADEIEKIHQKALEALSKARSGADFSQLAKEYSEDPGSKDRGGDLGWMDQNTQFVSEFKQAALSLGVGAISDLVTTQFGFHIIKATAHETAHTQSFEEAKELIRPTLMAQKTDRDAMALANQIYAAVVAKPEALDAIAQQFGATVRETPPFAMGDAVPDIGTNPDFERKVFATAVNKVGDPVRVAPGFAIPEVVEIKPPHSPELADVRDKVEKAFKQNKAVELTKQKADEFAKKATAAKDFLAAAKSAGLKGATSEAFKRNASEKGLGDTRDISAEAFNLKVGDTSVALRLGPKFVVFRVNAKEDVKPEDFEKTKASVTTELVNQKRETAFQSFQEELLARALRDGTVKVNEKAMNAAINRLS
jgi:peptidyl-prolyl cis-trans isomerase D